MSRKDISKKTKELSENVFVLAFMKGSAFVIGGEDEFPDLNPIENYPFILGRNWRRKYPDSHNSIAVAKTWYALLSR